MPSTAFNISSGTRKLVMELAQTTDTSPEKILDSAVQSYRRQIFLKRTNEAYARLKKDPKAWAVRKEELAEWDASAADGL